MTAAANRVVVAAASDEAYALPLSVMLRSAAENLGDGCGIEAYVVADGISHATRARVEQSISPRLSLNWVQRPAGEFSGLPRWGRISLGTYHKLTLGSWLPGNATKAIWLDCDTLVFEDLARLWIMEPQGKVALACRDSLVPRLGASFGVAGWKRACLNADAPYFNAGVMLIDVERWREAGVEKRSLDYLRQFGPKVWFWDQEALNAVLAGHWKSLAPSWNFPASMAGPSKEMPRIVHFSGNIKPWVFPGKGALHTAYGRYLDRTAWKGWRPAPSWKQRLLSIYIHSPLRPAMLPLERLHMRWTRWATMEFQPQKNSSR
ncbi:MAG: glycosyltransferase family 8 protein [Verrucomicrobia bacterium]|nr:glycosyltransferase family 8 protein [Verrucomicrobiota bacterium]